MLEARLNHARAMAAKYGAMYDRTGKDQYRVIRDQYRAEVDKLWQRLMSA